MTELPEKKGMSKGCLITLIIVGVLIVMIVIAGLVCYMKRDDIIKFGVKTLVSGVKVELAENPVEGIDTVNVNAMADAFILKIDSSEINAEKMAIFSQTIQTIIGDKELDSLEVVSFMEAMVKFYPELKEYMPSEELEEPDSVTVEQ